MAKYGKEAAAQTLARIVRWQADIKKHAQEFDLQPSVVAAIISRETAGLTMFCEPPPKGQLGDKGYGHGPMQIDKRSFPEWCTEWAAGKLTISDGIRMGCKVLRQKLNTVEKLIPDLPKEKLLEAGVSSYNCGESNVRKAYKNEKPLDAYTTGKNYGTDTLERAAYFRDNGFPDN